MIRSIRNPGLLRILLAGEAGTGVLTSGEILFESLSSMGLEATLLPSFPSTIKSGLACALLSVSDRPLLSPSDECDLFIVLSRSALKRYEASRPTSVMVIDRSLAADPQIKRRVSTWLRQGRHVENVPVREIAKRYAGSDLALNMSALGMCMAMLGLPVEHGRGRVMQRFQALAEDARDTNLSVYEAGYGWAKQHLKSVPLPKAKRKGGGTRIRCDGNQAMGYGALHANCTFYASYPITPATSIGNLLSRLLPKIGGVSLQAEDEIAALGAVIGASYSGVRALTTTSGPGLSLMQELIGYSSMAEIPAVIVDVQRAGPSTGMPTKHEQSDLLAAALGGHGEGPRVVIAPQTVDDCFRIMQAAFSMAHELQCPVLVLSDASLGNLKATIPSPISRETLGKSTDPFGKRRKTSPLTGAIRVTGIEHNERSVPISDPHERQRLMERRLSKLKGIERRWKGLVEWDLPDLCSGERGELGVLSWGISAWVTKESVALLRREGISVIGLYPRLLYPLCTDALKKLSVMVDQIICVEANATGQYASLVKMAMPFEIMNCLSYCGEPFTSGKLAVELQRILERGRRAGR